MHPKSNSLAERDLSFEEHIVRSTIEVVIEFRNVYEKFSDPDNSDVSANPSVLQVASADGITRIRKPAHVYKPVNGEAKAMGLSEKEFVELQSDELFLAVYNAIMKTVESPSSMHANC